MLNMRGEFLTKAAHNSYNEEVLPFQRITCLLNVKDIKRSAFNLLFRFYAEDSKGEISEGYQTVVFINLANKKISRLPAEVVKKVRRFEAQE
jgi:acyl-CoA thioesterase FadM